MMSVIKYILVFLGLLILQISVLNNLSFNAGISIYLYAIFIILLPIKIKPWITLIIAFFIGLIIDGLTHSGGIHAAACVLIAFVRPALLNLFFSTYDLELIQRPSIKNMGLYKFVSFILILIFSHNLAFYFLDAFSLSNFFTGIKIVTINTILTTLLIIIFVHLFKSEK